MPGIIRRRAKAALAARHTHTLWKMLCGSASVCVRTRVCFLFRQQREASSIGGVLFMLRMQRASGRVVCAWSRTGGSKVKAHLSVTQRGLSGGQTGVSNLINYFLLKISSFMIPISNWLRISFSVF